MTYCVHRLGGATAHDHILSYWNTCWAISLSCNVAKGKRIKYGLDHRTLGPLDNFFGPFVGPFFLDQVLDHFIWGGRLIYNSSDFIISTHAKLGTNEIYQNPIVSIN